MMPIRMFVATPGGFKQCGGRGSGAGVAVSAVNQLPVQPVQQSACCKISAHLLCRLFLYSWVLKIMLCFL